MGGFKDSMKENLSKFSLTEEGVIQTLELSSGDLSTEGQWIPVTIQLLESDALRTKMVGFDVLKSVAKSCNDRQKWLARNFGGVLVAHLLPFLSFTRETEILVETLECLILLHDLGLDYDEIMFPLKFEHDVFRDMYLSTLVHSCGNSLAKFLPTFAFLPKILRRLGVNAIPYTSKILGIVVQATETYLNCSATHADLECLYRTALSTMVALSESTENYSIKYYSDIYVTVLLKFYLGQRAIFDRVKVPVDLFASADETKLKEQVLLLKHLDSRQFEPFVQIVASR